MPIVMVRPVLRDSFGSNVGHIDELIESYLIDMSLHAEEPDNDSFPKPEDEKSDQRKAILQAFRRAKARHETGACKGKGAIYWRVVIDHHEVDLSKSSEIERIGC